MTIFVDWFDSLSFWCPCIGSKTIIFQEFYLMILTSTYMVLIIIQWLNFINYLLVSKLFISFKMGLPIMFEDLSFTLDELNKPYFCCCFWVWINSNFLYCISHGKSFCYCSSVVLNFNSCWLYLFITYLIYWIEFKLQYLFYIFKLLLTIVAV